jgi:HPt (histidine-containing phosphotransfer) domain-containing protein
MTDRAPICEPSCEPTVQVDPAVSASELGLLDTKLDELSLGDSAVAQRYIRLLVDTNETTLVVLRDAVRASSWNRIASAAHRLAGSMRLLDCNGMVDLLIRLEAAARVQDAALVGALFPVVVRSLDYLDSALDALAARAVGN